MSEEMNPNQPEPLEPPLGVNPPQGAGASQSAQPSGPVQIDSSSEEFDSNYQRFADAATKQMNDAADAIRRGEFISDSVVDPSANSDDRLVALLDYLVPVLLPVIVLLSEASKKRPFQRYHAVQSLGLSGLFLILLTAISVVTAVLGVIPVVGWIVGALMFCLSPILFIMAMVAVIYYGVQAYQGKRFSIPVVTNFLLNQGWL